MSAPAAPRVRWQRSRRAWTNLHDEKWTKSAWAAFGLVVVAVVLGIIVGIRGAGGANSPPTAALAAPAATDTDQSIPTIAPVVTWVQWQGVALPDGGHLYGPTTHDGPDAVMGFAHTPRGALIATVNYAYRAFLSTDAGWRQSVADSLAGGPGAAVIYAKRKGCTTCDGPGPGVLQLASFRFQTYNDSLATIALSFSSADTGLLQFTTYTAIWKDGDWKLILGDDGQPGIVVAPLLTQDGFVPFLPGLTGAGA
jgi:hypothetical protein